MSTAPGGPPAEGPSEAAVATPFEDFAAADVRDLIAEFPLAWVCAVDTAAAAPSLLPLLGDYDEAGRLTRLIGHMGRRNPLVAALTVDPRALILFQGPQGYVSPEQAGRRDWAPTWNYAQLCVTAEVRFTPEETDLAVGRLVDTMEAGRGVPWRVEELGDRFSTMARQIIGFRADVTGLNGRFKLAQDEAAPTARAIVAACPDPVLARWMTRFNAGRL